MDPKNVQKINTWAAKLGIPAQELIQKVNKLIAEQMASKPGLSPQQAEQRAMYKLYSELKSQLRSRSKPFYFLCLGLAEPIDLTRTQRETALQIWHEDPQRAIAEGWTDAEGTPLDNREYLQRPDGTQFKNPNYMKPIQPVLRRMAFGVAQPTDGSKPPKAAILILRDENTNNPPPVGKTVQINVLLREELPDKYILYDSRSMKINVVNDVLGTVQQVLQTAPAGIQVPISQLEAWHVQHQNDRYAVVITKGLLTFKQPNATSRGSHILVIEDPDSMDIEQEGVTVFLPQDYVWMIDSVEIGDMVYVVGKTTLAPGWNPETGQLDENLQRVIINGWAVFPA